MFSTGGKFLTWTLFGRYNPAHNPIFRIYQRYNTLERQTCACTMAVVLNPMHAKTKSTWFHQHFVASVIFVFAGDEEEGRTSRHGCSFAHAADCADKNHFWLLNVDWRELLPVLQLPRLSLPKNNTSKKTTMKNDSRLFSSETWCRKHCLCDTGAEPLTTWTKAPSACAQAKGLRRRDDVEQAYLTPWI